MAFGVAGVNLVVNNVGGAIGAIVAVRRQLALLSAQSASVSTRNRTAASSFGTLGGAISAPSRALTGLGNAIKGIGGSLTKLGTTMSSLGLRMTFLASIPIISAFAAFAGAAITFETTLAKIGTLTDLAGMSFAGLQKSLLELAPQVGQTATALAEGLFVIASAGQKDAAVAMETLRSSAMAATIGLGETKDVARAVTAILEVYGDSGLTAATATDQLVATIREGNLEADRLAPALGRVLSVLDALGASSSEGLAFIATFTRSGVSAEEAVTSLRSTITTFLKPTQRMLTALDKAGVSLDEVRASIADPSVGLSDTLIGLKGALEASGQSMSDVFGNVRALGGVLFTTAESAEDFRRIQESIANSGGETAAAFELMSQTTGFQLQQLKAEFSVLAVTIGTIFLPAINRIIEAVKPVIAAISALALQNPKIVLLGTAFALLAAAMGPVLVIGGLLIGAIGTIVTAFGGLITVVAALISPIGLLIGGVLALAAALGVSLASAASHTGKKLGTTFGSIAAAALAWGRNIVISLARGIVAGAAAVIQALLYIGRIIRNFLQANSPPKLLPDLEDWGAAALTAYMQGWTEGDFSVFNDLAGTIEGFLRSVGTDVIPEEGLIPAILGSRDLVAQAINDIRELGAVSQTTLSAIGTLFGDAAAAGLEYTLALAAVGAAQEEVNRINKEAAAIIDPINAELQAIADRRQEVVDAGRVEELTSILSDEDAPALAKELAQMELREIELKKQLKLAEENKEVQLSAAEAELETATSRLNAAKALLDVWTSQNSLIQEQIKLLEQLADSMGGAGGLEDLGGLEEDDLAGVGGNLDEFLPGPLDAGGLFDTEGLGNELGQEFTGMFDDILGSFSEKGAKGGLAGFIQEILAEIDPFITQIKKGFNELGIVWSEVVTGLPALPDRLQTEIRAQIMEIAKTIQKEFLKVKDGIVSTFTGIGDAIKLALFGGPDEGFFAGIFSEEDTGLDLTAVGDAITQFSDILTVLFDIIKDLGDAIEDDLKPAFDAAREAFAGIDQEELKLLTDNFVELAKVVGVLGLAFAKVVALLSVGLVGGLIAGIATGVAAVIEFMLKLAPRFAEAGKNIVNGIAKTFNGIADIIKGIFSGNFDLFLDGIGKLGEGLLTLLKGLGTGLINAIIVPFGIIVTAVAGFVEGVFNFFKGLYNALVGESLVPDLVNAVILLFGNMIKSVVGEGALIPFLVTEIIRLVGELVAALTGEGGIIPTFVTNFVTFFTDLGTNITTAINTWIPGILTSMFDFGAEIIGNIIEGVTSRLGELSSLLTGIGGDVGEVGSGTGGTHGQPGGGTSRIGNIGGPQQIAAPAMSGGMISNTSNVEFGPTTINNGMDQAMFRAMVNRAVRQALSG